MSDLLNITSQEVLGDEFVVLRDGGGPWTDALLCSLREGALGNAFSILVKNPDADVSDHPYWGHVRNNLKYNDAQVRYEDERLRKIARAFAAGEYDEKKGLLLKSGTLGDREYLEGPVMLVIDADGSFITRYIPDGFHRMTCLAVLRKPIRLFVAERHKDWNDLRVDLYKIWDKKYLYQSIPHPDFETWEVGHGSQERFEAIERHIRENNAGQRVLDAGCNFGYLLFRLMKDGVAESGAAFDFAELPLRVAKRLLSFVGVEPEKADASAYFFKEGLPHFSAVCAISLIYHFIEIYPLEKTTRLLRRMVEVCDLLIFDDAPVKASWPEEVKRDGLVAYINRVTSSKAVKFGHDPEFNRGLWTIRRESQRA